MNWPQIKVWLIGALGWAILGVGRVVVKAHGPESEQVALLSAQLAKFPRDSVARLRRGELLRDHARSGDTNALALAREDFEAVVQLHPRNVPALLGLARVETDAGQWTAALHWVDRVLALSNQCAPAHLQRAEVCALLLRPLEAVAAFDATLRYQTQPRPETYLARARAQLAAEPTNFASVISGLDDGIRRMGAVPGLQRMALDCSLRAGQFSNALERLDAMAANSERQETWMEQRGDVLWAAGRLEEARKAWENSRRACTELSERWRATATIRELQRRLEEKLKAMARGDLPRPGAARLESTVLP